MPSNPTYKNLDALVEQPDSGSIEITDRVVLTKRYRAKYAVCMANLPSRGSIGTGDTAGYLVDSATVTRERGDMGLLTVKWAAGGGSDEGGQPLPADEFRVSPIEINPNIRVHPWYKPLKDVAINTEPVLAIIKRAVEHEDPALMRQEAGKLNVLDPDLLARANSLMKKLRDGNDAYYFAGVRYIWTSYHWTTPDITIGGYTESPGGPLAGYFHPSFSFLRESDALDTDSGAYRLTRSWLGSTDGRWEEDIYSKSNVIP